MKTLFTISLLVVFLSTKGQSQPQKDTIDPFIGGETLGGNNELIFQYAPKNGAHQRRIYDFIAFNNSRPPVAETGVGNEPSDNKDMDVITGDVNGDYKDEIISAWECEGNSIYLSVSIVNADRSLSIVYDTTFAHVVQTDSSYNIFTYKYFLVPSIKLTSCNLDLDYQDEFILSYYGIDGNLHIQAFESDENGNLEEITEIHDYFVLRAGNTDPHLYDITAGDFDQDGISEFVVINPYARTTGSNYSYFLHSAFVIYDFDQSNNILLQKFSTILMDKHTWSGITEWRQWYYNTKIASGDINADGKPEIVYGYVTALNTGTNRVFTRLNTFSVKTDLSGIVNRYTTGETVIISDFSSPASENDFPIDIKVADISGNGYAEIIAYAGQKLQVFEMDQNGVIQYMTGINGFAIRSENGNHVLDIGDLEADTSSTDWNPQIVVFDFDQYSLNVYKPNVNNNLKVTGLTTYKIIVGVSVDNYASYALALGDFDGDGIRMGKPEHTILRSVFMPTILLNTPPFHFDKLDKVYDVNNTYPFNPVTYPFYGVYEVSSTAKTQTCNEISHSWALSGEYSYGLNKKFGASIKASVGMDFNKKGEEIKTVSLSERHQTSDDEVYGRTITFHLFEYPVYYKGKILKHITAVVPVQNVSPEWSRMNELLSNKIRIEHETGNLLSYPTYESLDDIPDRLPDLANEKRAYEFAKIEIHDKLISNAWTLLTDNFTSNSVSTKINASISAEVSYKVPLYSCKLNADYKFSKLSFSSTSLSDQMIVKGNYGIIDMSFGECQYKIIPYIYWSVTGALVVDYGIDLTGPWWKTMYGSNPDLAFIMPFRYEDLKGKTLTIPSRKILTSDIKYYPYDAKPGDSIEIEVTVRNFSLCDTRNDVIVKLYLGDPDIEGSELLHTFDLGFISQRGKESDSFFWKSYKQIEFPWLFAVIDTVGITEIHRNNNKAFSCLFTTRLPEEGQWVSYDDDISVGIIETPEQNDLEVSCYPNPTKDLSTINFSSHTGQPVKIIIFNCYGVVLDERNCENISSGMHSENFDFSAYTPGLYFYQLTSGKSTITKKIIIE